MRLPPVNLSWLIETFNEAAREIADLDRERCDERRRADDEPVALTVEGLDQLGQVLHRMEHDLDGNRDAPPSLMLGDITELGDYGLKLLISLSSHASRLGLEERAGEIQRLCYPFALWLARQGAEIQTLEPVVSALDELTNETRERRALEELTFGTGEIVEAVSPEIRQDLENLHPHRPWRVLLINHAILATRSLQPGLMEHAFDNLVQHLPEEASQFFAEGMQQIDTLNYPAEVRKVMVRYAGEWAGKRHLH